MPNCRPFVKWAGGKWQLLSKLDTNIPQDVTRYFEPLVGGGTVFFLLGLTNKDFVNLLVVLVFWNKLLFIDNYGYQLAKILGILLFTSNNIHNKK